MVKLIGVLKMILLNPPNGPALSYHPAIFPHANISVLKVFWHFKSNFCIRTSLLNRRLLILFNDSLISDWQSLFCDYFLPGGRPFISFTFNNRWQQNVCINIWLERHLNRKIKLWMRRKYFIFGLPQMVYLLT